MSDPARRVRLGLLPQQHEFQSATETEVLFSGAVGAGKSHALCCKALAKAQIPGNRVGICRKTFETLEKSTLDTLLGLLDKSTMQDMLPAYHRNKNTKTIHLVGGGRIDYFGLDDIRKIGSYQWGSVGVDEAIELIEEDWKWLLSRLRVKADPCRQIFAATNPGTPEHFLYKRFYKDDPPGISRRAINTSTLQNWHLPDGYVDQMGYTGAWHRRYIEGIWCALEGGVYERFDRSRHAVVRGLGDFAYFVAGVDDGWTNPRACVVAGVDGDGRIHVFEEYYRTKERYGPFVEWLCDINATFPLYAVMVDPSASQLINELGDAGLPVEDADNAVLPGIQRVQNYLCDDGTGRPRLTVDPSCVNTLSEFETYSWRKNRVTGLFEDKPEKASDHAMDALRYLVMEIGGTSTPQIEVVGPDQDAYAALDDEEEWAEAVLED